MRLVCLLAAAACAVRVDYGGTAYRCDNGESCPLGQVCVAGECVPDRPGIDGASGDAPSPPDAAAVDAAPLPWWDSGYLHRLPFTVQNLASEPMTAGYQVGFAVPAEVLGASLATRNDVRILEWQGAGWGQLPRVDDAYDTQTPWIWFAISAELAPGASDGRYWIYFGHAAPGSPPGSPNDVMEFYDSFGAATVNLTRWAVLGAPTQVMDELVLGAGHNVRSNATWGAGYAVDFSLTMATWSARWWGGFQRTGDFMDDGPWLVWISRNPPTQMIWPEVHCDPGGVNPEALGPMTPVVTTKRLYGVERFPREIVFNLDEVEFASLPLANDWIDPQQIRLANEATTPMNFGMVRVRRVVRPRPSVTFGAVENYP
jgi:hypothetical protein